MPGPGEGFDVGEFVSGRHTLYMIGAGRDEAPIAPLFRAFAEYVHARAAFTGSLQPSGRLDPPMLMALDEVTQICPVPLPNWMADSAGKGILIVAVCHGLAQLEARWDSAGARAIWDTAGIKVILGGVADPDTLDRLSRLCGEIWLRQHSWTRHEDGRRARTAAYEPVQVLAPELLRMLPEWRALVVRGNLSPVVVRLRMAWRRHDYRHARRTAGTPPRWLPSIEAHQPPPDWAISDPAEELVPLPRNSEGWHFDECGPVRDEGEDVAAQPPTALAPPRPRRPWEPPADPRMRPWRT
jgi:type IV secretion system protein VirD4